MERRHVAGGLVVTSVSLALAGVVALAGCGHGSVSGEDNPGGAGGGGGAPGTGGAGTGGAAGGAGGLGGGASSARDLATKLGRSGNLLIGHGNDLNPDHDKDGAYTLGPSLDLHDAYLVGLKGMGGWPDWNAN